MRRRVQNILNLYANQKRLMQMVSDQIYEKEENNNLLIGILSHVVEFRNSESGEHILHIRTATELLLRRLVQKTDEYHLSESDIVMITTASALHDIGKISIPESILNKPGKLTREEFNLVMILFPDWSMSLIGMNRHSIVIRSKMLQIPIALPA